MQTRTAYVAASLFVAVTLAMSLASCGDGGEWHLQAARINGNIELCLSNTPQCPQPGGVSPDSITVYRWDNMHDNVLVWDVEPTSPITPARIGGIITWGQPPERWQVHMIPAPVVCGKAYLVNPGAHYFGVNCDATRSVVVFDAPKLEEFFRTNKSATPVRGTPSKDTMGPE
jgi:hypothetical protein